MTKNPVYKTIIIALIVIAIVVSILLVLRSIKEKKVKQQQQLDVQYQQQVVAAQQQGLPKPPPPPPVEPVLPPAAPLPDAPQPTFNVMSTDPTYIMASRMHDSLSSWIITPAAKTLVWASLASKSDDFIRHTNNWFNGQFGGGKTMRQRIEEQWTGEKSIILNKLYKLGI